MEEGARYVTVRIIEMLDFYITLNGYDIVPFNKLFILFRKSSRSKKCMQSWSWK
jgi:hypothetical protein